jgi:hypothetical protein
MDEKIQKLVSMIENHDKPSARISRAIRWTGRLTWWIVRRPDFIALCALLLILVVIHDKYLSPEAEARQSLTDSREELKTMLESDRRSVARYGTLSQILASERVLLKHLECSESALVLLRLMPSESKQKLVEHELLRCAQAANFDEIGRDGSIFALSGLTASTLASVDSMAGLKLKPGHTHEQLIRDFETSLRQLEPQLDACQSITDDIDVLRSQLDQASSPGKLWFVRQRFDAWRTRVDNSRRDKLCRVEY